MADQQQPTPAGEPAVLQALPRGLTPFSADELEELRLYRELVGELSNWELANRQMIELVIGAGGVIAKDIDRDSLVALATTFRKLGWLQKEPATFSRVRNLLGKHAHQAGTSEAGVVSQWLQDLKDLKTAALRGVAGPRLRARAPRWHGDRDDHTDDDPRHAHQWRRLPLQ